MKIHEYQAKAILRQYGVAVPDDMIIFDAAEAEAAAKKFDTPMVVVKAQIHAGGRGKGGGVKLAKSPAEARKIAEEMLGMKLIYMDAGSGADIPINQEMISKVAEKVSLPLIVGGGINNLAKVSDAVKAGADLLVVGNGIEKNPGFLPEVSEYLRNWNKSLKVH